MSSKNKVIINEIKVISNVNKVISNEEKSDYYSNLLLLDTHLKMRTGVVELYFRIGFTNKEIPNLLAHQHDIIISIRTVKRISKKVQLFR